MKPDTEKVLSILAVHENNAANLIAILQDVQAEYNYLSEANLTLIADTLDISVSRVYSVATFYENFSLEAKGKHIIKVAPAQPAMCANPARSTMRCMSIWVFPARKRPRTTGCSRWRPWRASARAALRRS